MHAVTAREGHRWKAEVMYGRGRGGRGRGRWEGRGAVNGP